MKEKKIWWGKYQEMRPETPQAQWKLPLHHPPRNEHPSLMTFIPSIPNIKAYSSSPSYFEI